MVSQIRKTGFNDAIHITSPLVSYQHGTVVHDHYSEISSEIALVPLANSEVALDYFMEQGAAHVELEVLEGSDHLQYNYEIIIT
jgi:hypothetical protein